MSVGGEGWLCVCVCVSVHACMWKDEEMGVWKDEQIDTENCQLTS